MGARRAHVRAVAASNPSPHACPAPADDAVTRVPPVHFQPRLKRRDVPQITFLEDRLLRRFREKNAAIAAFDRGAPAAGGAFSRTIAAQFIEQQLARMRGGADEAAAFRGARAWMLTEGPRLFPALSLPAHVRAAATAAPADVAAARVAADEALAAQLAGIREALAREGSAAAGASAAAAEEAAVQRRGSWRAWAGERGAQEAARVAAAAARAYSREPVLPRRPAGAAGAAAAGDGGGGGGGGGRTRAPRA